MAHGPSVVVPLGMLLLLVVMMVMMPAAHALPEDTRFFFPRECYYNTERTCCPSFANGAICGGSARGDCVSMLAGDKPMCNGTRSLSLFWITDYFDNVCQCHGNYYGVGCEYCRPGWTGDQCETPMPLRVRRDIDTLPPAELQRFVDGVMLLTTTTHPFWPGEITMWQWLGAMHAWAKDPLNNTNAETISQSALYDGVEIDYAHNGPALLSWHRAFHLQAEYLLGKVLNDNTYAIPYWNWTKEGSGGVATSVALSLTGGDGDVNSGGGLYNCSYMVSDEGSYQYSQCNCTVTTGPFASLNSTGYWGTDVIALLYDANLDALTFQTEHIQRSLGCFSRLAASDDSRVPLSPRMLAQDLSQPTYIGMSNTFSRFHGAVHMYVGWTLRLGSPPTDPLFFLHHSMVDLSLERWIRGAIATDTLTIDNIHPATFPGNVLLGHTRDECLAPMVPLSRNMDWMLPSWALGYTYDYLASKDEVNVTTPWSLPGASDYIIDTTTVLASVPSTVSSADDAAVDVAVMAATQPSANARRRRHAKLKQRLAAAAADAALQPL